MRPVIPRTAPERFGVFTLAEALASGWTESQLRTAVLRDRVTRLHRGVYIDAETWRTAGPLADQQRLLAQTVAAALVVVSAMASHTSSALLAGLPVWELPSRPCLTVPPRFSGDAIVAHLHRAGIVPAHVVTSSPVRRLRTTRSILDIAREHGVEDAVVAGDCALARGMLDDTQLLSDLEFCAGWPGIRRAERMLTMLDGRAESPLESVSRLRMSDVGVLRPDLQPDILDLSGRFLGRPDFYWDEFGVCGEVDGLVKYAEDPLRAMWDEKQRQERMEDAGLLFLRWGRAGIENMPQLRARLERRFATGALRARSERAWVVESRSPIRALTFAPLSAIPERRNRAERGKAYG